jgi:hypothetical protein
MRYESQHFITSWDSLKAHPSLRAAVQDAARLYCIPTQRVGTSELALNFKGTYAQTTTHLDFLRYRR